MCFSCIDDDDCGGGVCGSDYECVECTRHADCISSACDLEVGECIETGLEFWVDGTGCPAPGSPSQDPGFGSADQPYCWISTALAAVSEGAAAIVHGSGAAGTQPQVDVSGTAGRTIVLLGDNDWVLGGVDTVVRVGDSNRLFVSEVDILGATTAGVHCDSAGSVWLTDSSVAQAEVGVSADGCDSVELERTQIQESTTDGLRVVDSRLTLTSSTVVRNGQSGSDHSSLRIDGSEFTIRYSTIAGNLGAPGSASLRCAADADGEIANSVIVAPGGGSIDCPTGHIALSVVDTTVADGSGNVVVREYDSGWFADMGAYDVHIAEPAASPFANVARWTLIDSRRDLDGTRRLAYPAEPEFAGADQP